MAERPNPLRLNKLQQRTLALAQVIAEQPGGHARDDVSGNVTLISVPHAHGDHVHVGPYVVAAREASGFSIPAVWVALARKGLAANGTVPPFVLTEAGVKYNTGLGDRFLQQSDH